MVKVKDMDLFLGFDFQEERSLTGKYKDQTFNLNFYFDSLDKYSFWEKKRKDFLSQEELQYFNSLKHIRRQKSFLMGRLAAKIVLGKFLKEKDLNKINISSGIFNQPIVEYCTGLNPGLTISHSENHVIAAAFPEACPVGVDIEQINKKRKDIFKKYVSKEEFQLLSDNKIDKCTGGFLVWTVKEAMSKVLKSGLLVPFDILEIKKINYQSNQGQIVSEFKNFCQYTALSYLKKDYVYSVVLPANLVPKA